MKLFFNQQHYRMNCPESGPCFLENWNARQGSPLFSTPDPGAKTANEVAGKIHQLDLERWKFETAELKRPA